MSTGILDCWCSEGLESLVSTERGWGLELLGLREEGLD